MHTLLTLTFLRCCLSLTILFFRSHENVFVRSTICICHISHSFGSCVQCAVLYIISLNSLLFFRKAKHVKGFQNSTWIFVNHICTETISKLFCCPTATCITLCFVRTVFWYSPSLMLWVKKNPIFSGYSCVCELNFCLQFSFLFFSVVLNTFTVLAFQISEQCATCLPCISVTKKCWQKVRRKKKLSTVFEKKLWM